MTKQEHFKQRVRARMAATGERYAAARRSLIETSSGRPRRWVSQPEVSDERVTAATGRSWEAWVDLIEAWPGHGDGHTAIAAYLVEVTGVDGWWAQTVTVGYERIVGLRLPHQLADGTFTANTTRTIDVDVTELREMLLDDETRRDLFSGLDTELRSKPTSKSLRIRIGPGVALFSMDQKPHARATVTVSHTRLTTADDVDRWKFYWSEWLEAIASE